MDCALSPRIRSLADWLVLTGASFPGLDELFRASVDRLASIGLPLDRVSLNLEFLHPEVSGEGREWLRDQEMRHHRVNRADGNIEDYVNSPIYVVDQTGQPYRVRLDREETVMPLLQRLQREGYTDYVAHPFRFQDTQRTAAITFATKQAGGFSDADFVDITKFVAAFTAPVEARVVRTIAKDLLSTYLGDGVGARVYDGAIVRGDYESIFAAVWFCDLRGFTAFTQENLNEDVIRRLNCWFGLAVQAVEAHGGEVLKFMGDGMMAIFPADAMDPRVACGHALAACADLSRSVAAWNESPPKGQVPMDYGLSLHLGYVAFGNIGGPRRLDFTVVGPAVNVASRLMDVAKALNRRVVVSQAFVGCSGREFAPLGTHELRGLLKPEPVFGVD